MELNGTGSPYDVLTRTERVVDLRNRHRDYHLHLAELAEPELRGPDQVAWLDVLDAEHANLLAAIDWSLERGESDEAMRLAASLGDFWTARGHGSEGRARLSAVLDASTDSSPRRAKALLYAANMSPSPSVEHSSLLALARDAAVASGDKPTLARALVRIARSSGTDGPRLAQEAVEVARESGDRASLADALHWAGGGLTWNSAGTSSIAMPLLDEALDILRDMGDDTGTAEAAIAAGWAAYGAMDIPSAHGHFSEALRLARRVGNDNLAALACDGLAWTTDDLDATRAFFEESVDSWRRLGDPGTLAMQLQRLASFLFEHGEYAAAEERAQESIEVLDAAGLPDVPRWAQTSGTGLLAYLAQESGRDELALALARKGVSTARQHGGGFFFVTALRELGAIELAQGNLDAARTALREADEVARSSNVIWRNRVLLDLASVERVAGNLAAARSRVEEALEISRTETLAEVFVALATNALGRVTAVEGNVAEAFRLCSEALSTLVRLRKPGVLALEALAGVASAQGRHPRAARLLGAAAAGREAARRPEKFWERTLREPEASAVRAALGDERFVALSDEGRALGFDDAVAYALEDRD